MELITHYKEAVQPGAPQIVNWRKNDLGSSLYYAHRVTQYSRATFPSRLHCHDYFELVIFEEGDIHYICESAVYQPRPGDVLLISPGKFHMSKIRCEKTLYKRHVFYLFPDALDAFGCGALTAFLKDAAPGLTVFSLEQQEKDALLALLLKLDQSLEHKEDPTYKALAVGLVIQIFFLLSQGEFRPGENAAPLPQKLAAIKAYIDERICEVSSAEEIAAHFFYSREYVSRLFRKHFNTTVSEYIKARRIARSKVLIEGGCPIGEACYQSGFENMSTFLRAFRSITGMTPSEYRKALGKKM